MNRIKQILLPSIILIIILVGVILYQIKTYKPSTAFVCKMPVPFDFCGTHKFTENGLQGKNIFNANCAACHKKYARYTGPALREIDSLVFVKWLTNRENKIDSSKIELYGIDYHKMTFSKTLNENEIAGLIEYCNN
ncbi:cytochrome c [Flavobacterium sp. ANB]|uniref:c-type cytochrome n=1 Tax=unclassified Flavobacterium TaxID=196869 RepID=UPI00188A7C21|nr:MULTISPECIES: cytochrome c [unclassified Flavobacterium]MBF4517147.1 cytochrome c [Flavobacterium sp. ANB]